jgi:hypothetical protein
VVLVLAIPVLAWTGVQVVLQSNDGRLIASTADPSSPGWVASIPTTPTMVVATVDDNGGGLSSLTLLAETTDKTGTLVYIPVDTLITVGNHRETFVDAYRRGGQTGVLKAVEALTGSSIGSILVANSRNWEQLVTPAGALSFDNPDDVIVNGRKLFAQGRITVPPDQVGAYIESRNWSEDDTNRLLRQQSLWQAWLAKIKAAPGSSAVPGETDAGIGKFLLALSREGVNYEVLPVQVHALAHAYAGVYLPLAQARLVLAQAIPFPASIAAGDRPTVRVLDGTGRLGHGLAAARNLAYDGAQIDSIGNAGSFQQAHTRFIVSNAAEQAVAQQLRDAFGLGTVVLDAGSDDTVDITIVLGADALGHAQVESTSLVPTSSSTPSTGGAGGTTTVTGG